MRDLVPWPGLEPGNPAWARGVLATGPSGTSSEGVCLKFQEAATLFPRRPQLWLQFLAAHLFAPHLWVSRRRQSWWVGFLGAWRPAGDYGPSRKMPRSGDQKACWKAPKTTPSTGWASADPTRTCPELDPMPYSTGLTFYILDGEIAFLRAWGSPRPQDRSCSLGKLASFNDSKLFSNWEIRST